MNYAHFRELYYNVTRKEDAYQADLRPAIYVHAHLYVGKGKTGLEVYGIKEAKEGKSVACRLSLVASLSVVGF